DCGRHAHRAQAHRLVLQRFPRLGGIPRNDQPDDRYGTGQTADPRLLRAAGGSPGGVIMAPRRRRGAEPASGMPADHRGLEAALILAALPDPVIVIDRGGYIRFVNPAAEQFLGSGAAAICGTALAGFVAPHSPLLSLVASVWRGGNTISEYDMLLEGPRLGSRLVTIQGTLTGEGPD